MEEAAGDAQVRHALLNQHDGFYTRNRKARGSSVWKAFLTRRRKSAFSGPDSFLPSSVQYL